LYQIGGSVTTGDVLLEPLPDRIGQIHGFAAEVDPRQAVCTLEILDDVPVVLGTADLGDTQEADKFVLGHDGGAGKKVPSVLGRTAGSSEFWSVLFMGVLLRFLPVSVKMEQGYRRRISDSPSGHMSTFHILTCISAWRP
jgi:hypothetical protein